VNDAAGTLAAAIVIAVGLTWFFRQTRYWLWVFLGGFIGVLALVLAFLLGAAFAHH
jgi:hypothetical protein